MVPVEVAERVEEKARETLERGVPGKIPEGKLLEILKGLSDGKYHEVMFYEDSGAGDIYLARWGPNDGECEWRIIKLTKKEPVSPRARRHISRGYTTENELTAMSRVSSREDPEKHNLIGLCDFFQRKQLEKYNFDEALEGYGYIPNIIGEKYFKSKPLKKFIEENGPANRENFRDIFSNILFASNSLVRKFGMYHRDINSGNILVGKTDRGLEARLCDLANTCLIENVKESMLPTAGAHFVTDPRLMGVFTGKEAAYGEDSEAYSLGENMYFALTGKHAFEFDPDEEKAVVLGTGESLLNEDGRLDEQKYEQELKRALKKLPRWARAKYGNIIQRCLTLREKDRYSSLDKLLQDFNRASEPGFLSKFLKSKTAKQAVAGVTAAAALAIAASTSMLNNQHSKNLETAVEEASKYEVATRFDCSTLEITNNLFDLELKIYNKDSWDLIYGKNGLKGTNTEPAYLQLRQGQKLKITPEAMQIPRPNKQNLALPTLKGKVYFEGYPGKEIYADVLTRDTDISGEGYWPRDVDLEVPGDMPNGNYNLIVELCAHDKPDPPDTISALSEIRYKAPGKVISRRRIPVVVGEIEEGSRVGIRSLMLSFDQSLNLGRLGDQLAEINRDLTYDVWIPELGFRETKSKRDGSSNTIFDPNMGLPKPTDLEEKTLGIVLRNKGAVIGYSFFPVRPFADRKQIYWLEFSTTPNPDFSDKLVKYRQEIYSNK